MAARDVLLRTHIPTEKFDFTWEIHDISKTVPYGAKSAMFSPSSFLGVEFYMGMKFAMELRHRQCTFFLGNCSRVPKKFRVRPKIKLYSSEEKYITENEDTNPCDMRDGTIVLWNLYDSEYLQVANCFFTLTSDILIVKCHLEMFGHCIKSTSNASVAVKSPRKNLCNLSSDLKALYKSKIFSDITVRIGKKVLKAHQTVLVARSSVFKSMLESDFSESKSKRVTITDVDFDVFECFLKYLYSGDIDDTSYPTALQLYALADKYAVSGLQEECGEILASNLSVENVCAVLELAYLHSDSSLKNMTINFITHNFAQVGQKSEWGKIMKDFPELSSEVLASVASLFGTLK